MEECEWFPAGLSPLLETEKEINMLICDWSVILNLNL